MADDNSKVVADLAKQYEDLHAAADKSSSSLEQIKQKLQDLAARGIQGASDALRRLNTEFSNASQLLDQRFGAQLEEVGQQLSGLHIQTTANANVLGTLTVMALGATKAFEGFGDIRGISSFTRTIGAIKDDLSHVTSLTSPLITNLTKMFGLKTEGMGLNQVKDQIVALLDRMTAGADSALQLRMGFLQVAAAGGAFGQVGNQLSNLNAIVEQQASMFQGVAEATGIATEDVVKFYKAWASIPGNLQAVATSTGTAREQTDAFSQALRLAAGTGQTVDQVMTQLSDAQANYGLTAERANEYVARTAELSQELGVGMQDAIDYMHSVSQEFRFLGDNADGAAQNFAKMFDGLRAGGISMRTAAGLAGDMQRQLAGLSTAQMALLSARTGGPGGLMGAAQIEQMLKQGRVSEVYDRVRQVLTQQMGGQIVTLDQAARSPAAAAQFQRERQLIMSGVFGIGRGFNEAQATDVIQMLARPGGRLQQAQAADVLRGAVDKGTQVQAQSLTALNEIVANTEGLKMLGGFGALRGLAGAAGGIGVEGMPSTDLIRQMQRQGTEAEQRAGRNLFTANRERAPGLSDEAMRQFFSSIRDLGGAFGNLPEVLRDVYGVGAQEETRAPTMAGMTRPTTQMPARGMARTVQAAAARPMVPTPAPTTAPARPGARSAMPGEFKISGTLELRGGKGELRDAQIRSVTPIPSQDPGY
jgi:hypothetical protein